MNESLSRRLGILALSVLLVAAAIGFAYVARVTQTAAQQMASDARPSVLPLAALAMLAAFAGLGTFRLAVEPDAEQA